MDDIRRYEAMAKLDLPDGERAQISKMADGLIAGMDAFASVDTNGIEPLVTVLDITNVLREDVVNKTIPREELLSGAPAQFDGYFQVPRTL